MTIAPRTVISAGSEARQTTNAAVRFVPITRFQRSSVCSPTATARAGTGAEHERIEATEALEAGRDDSLRVDRIGAVARDRQTIRH